MRTALHAGDINGLCFVVNWKQDNRTYYTGQFDTKSIAWRNALSIIPSKEKSESFVIKSVSALGNLFFHKCFIVYEWHLSYCSPLTCQNMSSLAAHKRHCFFNTIAIVLHAARWKLLLRFFEFTSARWWRWVFQSTSSYQFMLRIQTVGSSDHQRNVPHPLELLFRELHVCALSLSFW
jgi:hypothetical protein